MWEPSVNTEKEKGRMAEVLIYSLYFLLIFHVLFYYVLKSMQSIYYFYTLQIWNLKIKEVENDRAMIQVQVSETPALPIVSALPVLSSENMDSSIIKTVKITPSVMSLGKASWKRAL